MARNQEKAQALLNKFNSFKKRMKERTNLLDPNTSKSESFMINIHKKLKKTLKSVSILVQNIQLTKESKQRFI